MQDVILKFKQIFKYLHFRRVIFFKTEILSTKVEFSQLSAIHDACLENHVLKDTSLMR